MSYLFKSYDDPGYFRLIPQYGVRLAEPKDEGNENFNTCWDGALSPDGVFYYTLSSEQGKCDHAKLMRYDYENNRPVDCAYMGDYAMARERQLPHSKFHTSINFRPKDGGCGYTVLAVTHNTDRAPQHTEWMPFAHQADLWEGFPGGQILEFDPDTGHAETWGTPVPRESIYGAKYDPRHDRLYMIGFIRGHVYSLDCKTRRVTDLGKAAEVFNYRLALAGDGNIYSCTKSGEYYRINTEKNCLEDLHRQVPVYPNTWSNSTHYRYLTCARTHPSGKFMYMTNSGAHEMFQYEFATGEFTVVGRLVPKDGLFPWPWGKQDYATGTFCIDKYGVIWYEQRTSTALNSNDVRLYPYASRLMRWDAENGKAPEFVGVMGTPQRVHGITVEMEYDAEHDRIYCVDHGTGFGHAGPSVIAIDLEEFRPHVGEAGPDADCQRIMPRHASPEEIQREIARRKIGAGEQNTEKNPFVAFPNQHAYPVRLWNHVLRPEDAEVIGLAWDEAGTLHVVTGEHHRFTAYGETATCLDAAKYVFRIRGQEITPEADWTTLADSFISARADWDTLKDSYKDWLRANILPQQPGEYAGLPEVTGRRYRAYATAECAWNGGRKLVGTRDALLALVDGEEVFALGNAAVYGPVRCLCTNADRTVAWGVAGDDEDMGYVFTYDDKRGVRQLGMLNYDSRGFFRPSASNILSSIALSPDGRHLAIGGADRLGTVHVISL